MYWSSCWQARRFLWSQHRSHIATDRFLFSVKVSVPESEVCTGVHQDIGRVISAAEGRGVYDKLNTVVGQFLEGEITYADDSPGTRSEKAIRMQKPVSLQAPLLKTARAFEVVAAELWQGESSDAYRSFGLSQFSGFWKQKNEGVE